MLRKKRGSLEWLEFDLFQEFPEIKHAVFLRHGGVSEGPTVPSMWGEELKTMRTRSS
jgi:hypothetical protein